MKRRGFLGAAATGLAAQLNGRQQETGGDDGGDVGSYDELDRSRFPSTASIGWIVERFVQIRSPNSPVVGHEVDATAFALEVATSAADHRDLVEGFDWDDLDMTGSDAFETLFESVAWPLEGAFDESFFDSYDLVWLGGVHADYYTGSNVGEGSVTTDLRFYDIYDHAPFVFGVAPTGDSPNPGTVVDVSATIEHAGAGNNYDAIGSGAAFLTLEDVSTVEDLRTDESRWQAGSEVSFTGLQHHPRPRLSSVLTDVDYEDDLPRPKGGSIVTKRGQATAGAGTGDPLSLSSTSQDVLVGETLSETWDDEGESEDDASDGDSGDSSDGENGGEGESEDGTETDDSEDDGGDAAEASAGDSILPEDLRLVGTALGALVLLIVGVVAWFRRG